MKQQNEEQVLQPELVPQTSLPEIIKAEIDMQIATAKAFPRSLEQFRKKALSMATFSEDIAESCNYALPRKQLNDKTNQWEVKTIEGPSVRLAEIVFNCYGNIRAAARVISNDGRTITAQGICHDLETNSSASIEVKRRITNKNGKTFTEDMQVVTGNAACAIAFRNAVFKVIPAALVEDIVEEVKLVARGTQETLIKRRDKAVKYFTDLGVKPEQITDVLGIKEINDIDLDALQKLSGMKTAYKNNESTLEELFQSSEEKDKLKKKEQAGSAADDTKKMMDEALKNKK